MLLAPRQLTQGLGPAYVEGVGGALLLEVIGTARQGFVEVERVGQVQLAVDPAGAVEPDLTLVDDDVALLLGSLGQLARSPA